MDIIWIAQQARPKDMGQMELRQAQLTDFIEGGEENAFVFQEICVLPGRFSVTPFASSTSHGVCGSVAARHCSTLMIERAERCDRC